MKIIQRTPLNLEDILKQKEYYLHSTSGLYQEFSYIYLQAVANNKEYSNRQ